MTLNLRLLTVLSVLAVAGVMMAHSALAVGETGETRPGWGYGDQNRVHTGPPGQSNRPVQDLGSRR